MSIVTIKSVGEFNKNYINIVMNWLECSDLDVVRLKQYVGTLFNTPTPTKLCCIQQSGNNYALYTPEDTTNKLIVNYNTLQYGFYSGLYDDELFIIFE